MDAKAHTTYGPVIWPYRLGGDKFKVPANSVMGGYVRQVAFGR